MTTLWSSLDTSSAAAGESWSMNMVRAREEYNIVKAKRAVTAGELTKVKCFL